MLTYLRRISPLSPVSATRMTAPVCRIEQDSCACCPQVMVTSISARQLDSTALVCVASRYSNTVGSGSSNKLPCHTNQRLSLNCGRAGSLSPQSLDISVLKRPLRSLQALIPFLLRGPLPSNGDCLIYLNSGGCLIYLNRFVASVSHSCPWGHCLQTPLLPSHHSRF